MWTARDERLRRALKPRSIETPSVRILTIVDLLNDPAAVPDEARQCATWRPSRWCRPLPHAQEPLFDSLGE
jgi:hypothetical protein